MNIGIDIDGVILDSEKTIRTKAELYNTINLNNRPIKDANELRIQEKYNWTQNEFTEFVHKYFVECSENSNFMPYVKEVTDLLRKEGHKLIIITARGKYLKEMRTIVEEKFENEGLKFDKYYWAQEEKADICVNENIDVMIEDYYTNCIKIANKNIKTLYFRDAGIKEIKDNSNITEVHNWGEIYKYIFNMTKERNNKI